MSHIYLIFVFVFFFKQSLGKNAWGVHVFKLRSQRAPCSYKIPWVCACARICVWFPFVLPRNVRQEKNRH